MFRLVNRQRETIDRRRILPKNFMIPNLLQLIDKPRELYQQSATVFWTKNMKLLKTPALQ